MQYGIKSNGGRLNRPVNYVGVLSQELWLLNHLLHFELHKLVHSKNDNIRVKLLFSVISLSNFMTSH